MTADVCNNTNSPTFHLVTAAVVEDGSAKLHGDALTPVGVSAGEGGVVIEQLRAPAGLAPGQAVVQGHVAGLVLPHRRPVDVVAKVRFKLAHSACSRGQVTWVNYIIINIIIINSSII